MRTVAPSSSSSAAARQQAGVADGGQRRRQLAIARLDQQGAPRSQPVRRLGGHPAQHVQAVRAAVQRGPRLVVACLRGHQPHLAGRDVRHVGEHDGDPSAQRGGSGRTGHPGRRGRRTRPGCPARSAPRPGRCRPRAARRRAPPRPAPHRARPIRSTGPPRRRPVRASGDRLADQELGAPAGHEDPGGDGDPQAAELGPAEHLLQRLPRDPAPHQRVEAGGVGGGRAQQPGLLLGEDASRGPQAAHQRVRT